jgi:hypothetical protein
MLAEKRINTTLKAQNQTLTALIDLEAGSSFFDRPNYISEVRSAALVGFGTLTYVAPNQYDAMFASGESGQPRNYTVVGAQMKVGPTPDVDYQISLTYLAKAPPLADSGGTNWLIEQNADVYLAATMCEALIFIKDQAALEVWEAKFKVAMDSLNTNEWGMGGTLAIRPDANTP